MRSHPELNTHTALITDVVEAKQELWLHDHEVYVIHAALTGESLFKLDGDDTLYTTEELKAIANHIQSDTVH